MNYIYSEHILNKMNITYLWKNNIIIKKKEENDLYYLYPTRKVDVNGRIFIALPISVNINNKSIRKMYNLI